MKKRGWLALVVVLNFLGMNLVFASDCCESCANSCEINESIQDSISSLKIINAEIVPSTGRPGTQFKITATATDILEIQSIFAIITINNTAIKNISLEREAGEIFHGSLDSSNLAKGNYEVKIIAQNSIKQLYEKNIGEITLNDKNQNENSQISFLGSGNVLNGDLIKQKMIDFFKNISLFQLTLSAVTCLFVIMFIRTYVKWKEKK